MNDESHKTDSTEDDAETLIQRCLQGNQSAYTALYQRFVGGIYRLCYSLVLNKQDAEDVVQESFVYAFKNLDKFDPERATFKTWLYTIAVSRCRNTYRRKRIASIDLTLLGTQPVAPKSEHPEARFAQRDAQDALVRALADIPPQLREAIVLRYGHGLTYREIAEVMDCPPKTAESRVRLAHNHLRGLLQPYGQSLLEELLSF